MSDAARTRTIKIALPLALAVGLLWLVFGRGSSPEDEAVLAVLEDARDAWEKKDYERFKGHFSKDYQDHSGNLTYYNLMAIVKSQYFDNTQLVPHAEITDVGVQVTGDTARVRFDVYASVSRGTNTQDVAGHPGSPEPITVGLRKEGAMGGTWKIVESWGDVNESQF